MGRVGGGATVGGRPSGGGAPTRRSSRGSPSGRGQRAEEKLVKRTMTVGSHAQSRVRAVPQSNHISKKFVRLFQPMYTLLLYTIGKSRKRFFFGITSDTQSSNIAVVHVAVHTVYMRKSQKGDFLGITSDTHRGVN
jgi:hypothetical protein